LYSWQLLQAHFIALAAGLKPDLASLAQGVHGTDEATLARRLEHDVDNFCTLQAVHHAVQYARDELERAGGLLLKAEEAHAVLVCAFFIAPAEGLDAKSVTAKNVEGQWHQVLSSQFA
jgi:hypothetical protein